MLIEIITQLRKNNQGLVEVVMSKQRALILLQEVIFIQTGR